MSDLVARLRASNGFRVYIAGDGDPVICADTFLMREAADRIAELEADVAALLETIQFTGYDTVGRYWPEFEGWGGGISRSDECHIEGGEAAGCWCCAPFSISARSADLIDPPGPDTVLPEGWRSAERHGTTGLTPDGGEQ